MYSFVRHFFEGSVLRARRYRCRSRPRAARGFSAPQSASFFEWLCTKRTRKQRRGSKISSASGGREGVHEDYRFLTENRVRQHLMLIERRVKVRTVRASFLHLTIRALSRRTASFSVVRKWNRLCKNIVSAFESAPSAKAKQATIASAIVVDRAQRAGVKSDRSKELKNTRNEN